jgi:hypothetical protein
MNIKYNQSFFMWIRNDRLCTGDEFFIIFSIYVQFLGYVCIMLRTSFFSHGECYPQVATQTQRLLTSTDTDTRCRRDLRLLVATVSVISFSVVPIPIALISVSWSWTKPKGSYFSIYSHEIENHLSWISIFVWCDLKNNSLKSIVRLTKTWISVRKMMSV